MKVLFISRAYPPVIGGIEKQNFEIYNALSNILDIKLVANTKGKRFLPVFIIISLYKLIKLRNDYDLILLGDGVLSILSFIVKLFSKKKIVCIVHGLDLTYQNFFYKKLWLNIFIKENDRFIAVGKATVAEAIKLGISKEKIIFIPNGVNIENVYSNNKDIANLLGFTPKGPILLTLGRLIKRKGVAWFIENVMTELDDSIIYLIAGHGPERNKITQSIESFNLKNKVIYLGSVSEEEKLLLLSSADIFIQPNIPVENDIEGFGLVILEAAIQNTFVIASKLEGLNDSITHGKNGVLVPPKNANDYIKEIKSLLSNKDQLKIKSQQARNFVIENYSWDKIAEKYKEVLLEKSN